MSGTSFTIPVAKTSLWIAAARYKESLRPDKLIDDQLAKVLLGSQLQETIEEMKKLFGKQAPQQSQRRRMAIRTRWAEDTILECIHANGITQIVNLACGLDTYAWRLPMPSNVSYYEIDFAEVMQYKSNTLGSYPILCNYFPISADLSLDWTQLLVANGFDKSKPTLWLTMGFLVYLKEESVHLFLERVNELSVEGSYYTSDITHSLGVVAEMMKANGSPAQFTTKDPENLFGKYGFTKTIKYSTYYEYAKTLGIELDVPDILKKPMTVSMRKGSSLILMQK